MSRFKQPISPHLSIYKPQITSILSIIHRFTGIFLSIATLYFSLWIIALAFNFNVFSILHMLLQTIVGRAFLFFTTWSFFYHLLNGIRHLIWDIGYGFSIKSINLTGWIVVILSFVLNLLIWFIKIV